MNVLFADSFYFLALLNPKDRAHRHASQYTGLASMRLLTTEYVLLEVADAFAAPPDRPRFLNLVNMLNESPDATIISGSGELFARGVDLYRRRPDKHWSLTDCLSFVVMQDHSIADALTGDQHFRQAGFRPLLALA